VAIEVSRATVVLDGRPVVEADGLATRRRLGRIEELFAALKGRHRQPNTSQQELTVNGGASTEVALSAMITAAYAGYERVRGKIGNVEFDAIYDVPGAKPAPRHSIVTLTKLGTDFDIVWHTDAPCDVAPKGVRVRQAALANWLDLTCSKLPKPCVEVVGLTIGADDGFEDVATMLRLFQNHSQQLRFWITRWLQKPNDSTEGAECGRAVTHEDPLSPPAFVREAVRHVSSKLRVCYEDGLKRAGRLEGVVAIRLTIGKDGHVSAAQALESEDELGDVVAPTGEVAVTTLDDRKVVDCMVQVYKQLELSAPPGRSQTFVYPMKFAYVQK
jgi:hypothetical protein